MDITFECRVPLPRAAVFRFHESPANLGLLLEAWPGFELRRHDGSIGVGSLTWVRQRVLGFLPITTGFLHTACDPPARFQERMVLGPYREFEHTHEFEDRDGSTLVRDRLRLALPPWYGGDLALRLWIAPWMERFFAFRHERLRALLSTDRSA